LDYGQDPAPGSSRRWAIFFIGSANFVLSMFTRVSTTVISVPLGDEMGLTSSQLAGVAAAFYYAFAFSQIPLGVALRRIGPRLSAAALVCIGLAGTIFFSIAATYSGLVVARILMGIGMSGNLMIVLALLAAWFPANRFASLSGTVVSVGVLGNLLAATPLALLSQSIGWRGSFYVVAMAQAVVGFVFVLTARDSPTMAYTLLSRDHGTSSRNFGHFFLTYSYWAISFSSFVRYGYFAALQGLWIMPYLAFGLGLGEIESANALLAMGLGYMVSLPISGVLSDRVVKSRKWVVLATLVGFCLLCVVMDVWGHVLVGWGIVLVLFLLGMFAGPGQIMYAHIKELVSPEFTSQAITAVNLFTVLGAAAMTQVIGLVMPSQPSNLNAALNFSPMWLVGIVALALACVFYIRVPESAMFKTR
jgi:MFS family permease